MPGPPDRKGTLGRVRWFFWQLPKAVRPLFRPVFSSRRYLGWWLFWFALALAVPLPFDPPLDAHARYTGLLLEWLGIGAVAAGLFGRARYGEEPGPLARALAHLREVGAHLRSAFCGPRTHTLHATGTVTAQGGVSQAKVRVRVSEDATLEQRVDVLESRLDGLENEAEQLESELRQETTKIREALKQERKARNAAAADLRSQVAEVATGDLHLEWMGVWWLAFGVALATLSPDLAPH